jgi:GTP-binding protein Era
MNKTASAALKDVDVVIFVVDRTKWTEEDQMVLERVQYVTGPLIVALNKTDRIEDKAELMPHLSWLQEQLPNAQIMPISAQHGHNLDALEGDRRAPAGERSLLPGRPDHRPQQPLPRRRTGAREDHAPDGCRAAVPDHRRNRRVQAAGQDLHIHALILVERDGQKKIIIGDKGERIKRIGTEARKDMELLFDSKIMLNLWVKVKGGWSDDERALRSLGYGDL